MTNTETGTTQLVHADPTVLLTDRNNRKELQLDSRFLASIADSGVMVPIVAVRTPDNALRVRMGHRRTAAAVAAGLETVPVYVIGDEATGDDAEIDRLVSQWSENEHRTGYLETERVHNIEQLSLLGVSAAQIAKRMKIERPDVDAALTVANNPAALERLTERPDLTLDQAAAFAEFESDPAALTRLEDGLRFGRIDHEIQRQRDAKELRTKRAAAAQPFIDKGYGHLDKWPSYNTATVRISQLIDAAGEPADPETIAPAHLAVYMEHTDGYTIIETGEAVDEEDIDFDADEDGEPEEGLHHPRICANADLWEPTYYCTNLTAAELHRRDGRGQSTAGETDEQKDARLAGRRQIIDNNKAWGSAETVRLEWLTTYLSRKTAPKGSAAFIADTLARRRSIIGGHKVGRTIDALLGTKDIGEGYRPTPGITALIEKASEGRAQVLVLAEILAAHEAITGKHVWRNHDENTVAYLRYLENIGYTLSEIETTACTVGH